MNFFIPSQASEIPSYGCCNEYYKVRENWVSPSYVATIDSELLCRLWIGEIPEAVANEVEGEDRDAQEEARPNQFHQVAVH